MAGVDTWRTKYRAEYPGWDYQLWTDKEVFSNPAGVRNIGCSVQCLVFCFWGLVFRPSVEGVACWAGPGEGGHLAREVSGGVPRLGLPALD